MNQLQMINRMLWGGKSILETDTSLWLKADNPLNTNTRWYDASPNNHVLTGTATLTNNVLNGQKGYVFNGSSNYFNGGDILDLNLNSRTIVAIYKGVSTFVSPISKYLSNYVGEWYVEYYAGYIHTGIFAPNQYDCPTTCPQPINFIKTKHIWDRINGNMQTQIGILASTINVTNPLDNYNCTTNLLIGKIGSFYTDGTICEIIVFDRLLTTTENTEVNTYLLTKYGL